GNGSFVVTGFLVTQIEQAEKNELDHHDHDRIHSDQASNTPAKVERYLCQPFVIDPRSASRRERVHVIAWKLVVLHQVLRVAEMPPDIGVNDLSTRHDELHGSQEERQHGQEGKYHPEARP